MKYLKGIIVVILLVFLDQLSKIWAIATLRGQEPIEVIPNVFEFHYLENSGAAFGMLENRILLFIIITIFVLGIMFYFYIKTPNTKKYLPMHIVILLVISGGLGNFIDRLRFNYVVDFLYFKLIDFPIFNLADCYVTISIVFLAILICFIYKEEDLEVYYFKKRCKQ